ncbi:MAG: AraC family transcriptional regulator [Bacteroidales bacterium]|nr:AraC family transcriptional regulator [Bacteroidales bacterium]MBN2820477.1 AraC family transcriptional regulator [Bacteroidales bacterium]
MNEALALSTAKSREIIKDFNSKETVFPVHKQLEPFIFSYLHGKIDFSFIEKFAARPIPTGNIVMILRFGSDITLYDQHFKNPKKYSFFVVGVQTLHKLSYLHTPENVDNLIISFKPGGFSRIFNRSAFDLADKIVDLSELVPPGFMGEIKNLTTLESIEERIERLNTVLLNLLERSTYNTSKNHIEVLDQIHKSQGNISLNDICKNLGITLRTIERSFRVNVGISPKEYIRIIRFNHIFQYLLEHRFEGWQEVIHRFGYFDQSHFIRDFKAVTGHTPGEFINFTEHGMIFLDRYQLVFRLENLKVRL